RKSFSMTLPRMAGKSRVDPVYACRLSIDNGSLSGRFGFLKQFHNGKRFLATYFCMIQQRNPVGTSQIARIGECLEDGLDDLHLSNHSCCKDVHSGSSFKKAVRDVFPSHMGSCS